MRLLIPFDVDPGLYFALVICLIGIVGIYITNKYIPGGDFYYLIIALVIVLFSFLGVFAISGSVYTETITICNHQSFESYVDVMDTHGNIYSIYDESIQMRIRDNSTTMVTILKAIGIRRDTIIKSDLPVICGNGVC